ncbi:MAG: alcohol dehydrogenase catalytic domain-containing protein [Planctomycetota bacterium]|jgi:threonine dehydrogenase-like Zn-dependent dehydrogenase
MRALVYDGSEPRVISSHPDPVAAEGEALVRPLRVGIGATELAICRGQLPFQGVLGQEFVGCVESVRGGNGLTLTGKRVVGFVHAVCGRCDMCRSGLRRHCRQQTILGQLGRDGCLAERFALPMSNLVPVPETVDDDHAVFAHPLAAAMQAVRQLTIEGKPYVSVLGDGPLALLLVQLMARLNASVRVVGAHPDRLALCERWGVKHRHVDDVGRRADQDIVVECTGTPAGLSLALELVRPRGTVVLKSVTRVNGQGLDLGPVVRREIELIGSGTGPVDEAIGLLERGEVDVISMLGRRMRLDDGPATIRAAAEPCSLKVVVEI